MRTITATWFEASVRYERQTDEGMQKMVTETYVVDAFTFGEAEEVINREMAPYATGEFKVKNITPATFGEVVFSDGENQARVPYHRRDNRQREAQHHKLSDTGRFVQRRLEKR